MNKKEFTSDVAQRLGSSSKEASCAIKAVLGALEDELAGDGERRILLIGFGTFEARTVKAQIRKNPKTGEQVEIPERQKVVFKPGKRLKEKVNS